MKLQEDISRIKNMMGIVESKKHSTLETMVDSAIDRLKKLCNEMEVKDGDLDDICTLINSDLQVKINRIEVRKMTIARRTEVYLDITYRNAFNLDVDPLIYEINYYMRKWMGDNLMIMIENDVRNLYKEENPQW